MCWRWRCIIIMRVLQHEAVVYQPLEPIIAKFRVIAVEIFLPHLIDYNTDHKLGPIRLGRTLSRNKLAEQQEHKKK